MAVHGGTLARLRSTVARHLRRGFVRAVFVAPASNGGDEEIIEGDGSVPDPNTVTALLERASSAARAGRVKQTWLLDARTRLVVDARHGSGKLFTLDDERVEKLMAGKARGLRPDQSGELLREIGIMNPDGTISAKHAKKYKQITHFVELCRPIWASLRRTHATEPTSPIRVLDLGCGNGYLTFVIAQALRLEGLTARIHGVDVRDDVISRCRERASRLKWDEMSFSCATIANRDLAVDALGGKPDLIVALHACDTATDDALALAIDLGTPAMLVAPCCQHELAGQLRGAAVENLSPAIVTQGLLRQDFAATLTDALRVEILSTLGWSVDTLEFVSDTHTPKNLLIRALLQRLPNERTRLAPLRQRCEALGIAPRLLANLTT